MLLDTSGDVVNGAGRACSRLGSQHGTKGYEHAKICQPHQNKSASRNHRLTSLSGASQRTARCTARVDCYGFRGGAFVVGCSFLGCSALGCSSVCLHAESASAETKHISVSDKAVLRMV